MHIVRNVSEARLKLYTRKKANRRYRTCSSVQCNSRFPVRTQNWPLNGLLELLANGHIELEAYRHSKLHLNIINKTACSAQKVRAVCVCVQRFRLCVAYTLLLLYEAGNAFELNIIHR